MNIDSEFEEIIDNTKSQNKKPPVKYDKNGFPLPNKSELRKQALFGLFAISFYSSLCLFLTQRYFIPYLSPFTYYLIVPLGYTSLFLVYFNIFLLHYTDPGIITPVSSLNYTNNNEYTQIINNNNIDKDVDWTYCQFCKVLKPPRTHHCSLCQRCFRNFDHHCSFLGLCIAEKNKRFFIFVFIFAFLSQFCMLISVLFTQVPYIIPYLGVWPLRLLILFGTSGFLHIVVYLCYTTIKGRTQYYTKSKNKDTSSYLKSLYLTIFYPEKLTKEKQISYSV